MSRMCSLRLRLRFDSPRYWSISTTRKTTQKVENETSCNDCEATSESRQATTFDTTIGIYRKRITNNDECWIAKHKRAGPRGTRSFVIKAHYRHLVETNDPFECFEWLIFHVSRFVFWNFFNFFEQFVRFSLDSHVLFEVGYPFHLTRYCWLCCFRICSTSYSWSFCDL